MTALSLFCIVCIIYMTGFNIYIVSIEIVGKIKTIANRYSDSVTLLYVADKFSEFIWWGFMWRLVLLKDLHVAVARKGILVVKQLEWLLIGAYISVTTVSKVDSIHFAILFHCMHVMHVIWIVRIGKYANLIHFNKDWIFMPTGECVLYILCN